MVLLKFNYGSLNLKARDSRRLSLLRDWGFILFRWIAGYGSLIQPSHHSHYSQPIPSPPKTLQPSFPCSARRQPRRVLPTGRKVLPHPVGPFDYPQVWIPQPCGPFLIFFPDAELYLQHSGLSSGRADRSSQVLRSAGRGGSQFAAIGSLSNRAPMAGVWSTTVLKASRGSIESMVECEKSMRFWSNFGPRLQSPNILLSATREPQGWAHAYLLRASRTAQSNPPL